MGLQVQIKGLGVFLLKSGDFPPGVVLLAHWHFQRGAQPEPCLPAEPRAVLRRGVSGRAASQARGQAALEVQSWGV